ncbi:MAG: hypothetical protein J7J31_08510 [Helicobacteraceae bacterium]|nr:hypothetical protein [Helicobacteraceae bacterium]
MQVGSSYLYDASTKYYTSLGDGRYLVAREKNEDPLSTDATSQEEEQKPKDPSQQNQLEPSEEQMLMELQARDAEVRQHEAAHKSAGAPTGAANYTYQKGPDGRMYAIGGEVSVTMKSGSTPEETIANAQAVIASAMAPADPSPQDHAVASSARMMMLKAEQEKAKEIYAQNAQQNQGIKEQEESQTKIDFSA